MKLNSAVTKVYAFLNKLSLNRLFKEQASEKLVPTPRKSNVVRKSKQKSNFRRIIEPIAFVLAGLLCFAYPVCSTLWNNRVSKEISAAYDKYNHDQAGDV
ncbi:hypothetical protein HMPREF1581_00220, partial [Gardnerella vaginalis JCP8108]